MRWFRMAQRRAERHADERRLSAAEVEVARIRVRAERVGPDLERRLRRNYWSEAAIAIARRDVTG